MINSYLILIIYINLSLIWIYILHNLLFRYGKLSPDNLKVNALVKAFIVFSIALTLDSLYWTVHAFSLIEIIPGKISHLMGSPGNVFMIKILLLIAGFYLVVVIRRRNIEELALEGKEKKEIELLNIELNERNREILKFAHVIKGISECVFIADMEGNISFINDAVKKLLEYDDYEIAGKSFLSFFPGKNIDELRSLINLIVQKRWEEEIQIKKKNGHSILVHFSASAIRDEQNNPIYIAGIFRDITQKKLWEEQMIQAEKLSSIGQLIAGITHEINNPLTGIMGFAQFLKINPKCDKEMQEDLETINREAIRAKEILQKLMVFSRNHEITQQLISVNDMLKETKKLFNYELKKGNLKFVEELEENLPSVTGDPHQFQQIFLNIATNAIQAMSEHGGTLTVKTEKQNDIIKITFSDTGPGIKPEDIPKVFDPFFTTKKVGEGTGLGLSVSYGMVKQNKGKIYVHSKEGEGAVFTIEFPVEHESVIFNPEQNRNA
ncbi:MAG: ATP-binding protein [Candidatus Eremiobacterota bacterium]